MCSPSDDLGDIKSKFGVLGDPDGLNIWRNLTHSISFTIVLLLISQFFRAWLIVIDTMLHCPRWNELVQGLSSINFVGTSLRCAEQMVEKSDRKSFTAVLLVILPFLHPWLMFARTTSTPCLGWEIRKTGLFGTSLGCTKHAVEEGNTLNLFHYSHLVLIMWPPANGVSQKWSCDSTLNHLKYRTSDENVL